MPEDKVIQEEFPKTLEAVPKDTPKARTRATVREKVAEMLDPAKDSVNEMGFTVEQQDKLNLRVRALLELARQGAVTATGHKKNLAKTLIKELDAAYVK